jgi:hypothetical protein
VTSTAISDVGWFLMLGAALFLGVWWVRNARHGRRARQLIPRPDDEPASAESGPVPAAGPDQRARPASANPAIANPNTAGPSTASPATGTRSTGHPSTGNVTAASPAATGPDAGHRAAASTGEPGRPSLPRPGARGTAATGSGASPGRAGAASRVEPGPGFVVRSGRESYPAKHTLRPPR